MRLNKLDVIKDLKRDLLSIELKKTKNNPKLNATLGPILNALPGSVFPLGCLHEFLIDEGKDVATTYGFVCSLIQTLLGKGGIAIWVGPSNIIFPPALKRFGIDPAKIIFIDLHQDSDIRWAMYESMKVGGVCAVIGLLQDFDFVMSRRLQLAVEHSSCTGFILRRKKANPSVCVARWRITSLPGIVAQDLPGVGFPQWRVELLKIKNGNPGHWDVYCMNGTLYHHIPDQGGRVNQLQQHYAT